MGWCSVEESGDGMNNRQVRNARSREDKGVRGGLSLWINKKPRSLHESSDLATNGSRTLVEEFLER